MHNYIGRFAPTPTGLLHFGSLLTALASYLDARHQHGKWLVRIEDLDPPREVAGATTEILRTLECYGLHWDDEVWYQSNRHSIYQSYIDQFLANQQAFYCACSRKQLPPELKGVYPGTCRGTFAPGNTATAVRLQVRDEAFGFTDLLQDQFNQNLQQDVGDFVIRRKDGLYAYHLAVVVDDHEQHISNIVRGMDLLDSTPRHLYLQNLLNFETPSYAHLPLIVNEFGQKISKQTFAKPIPNEKPTEFLWAALQALGQSPEKQLRNETPEQLLTWAVAHWDLNKIPRCQSIAEKTLALAL